MPSARTDTPPSSFTAIAALEEDAPEVTDVPTDMRPPGVVPRVAPEAVDAGVGVAVPVSVPSVAGVMLVARLAPLDPVTLMPLFS